MSDVSNPT